MSQSKVIGAIEIGTAQVTVLVGELVNGRSLNLIGMGESSTDGIKKGEIVDFKQASVSTHSAIMSAEKSAGVAIEEVYLALTGGHLDGTFNTGFANVSDSSGIVSGRDAERAVAEAKARRLPAERLYVHHIRHHFKLDGHPVADPVGLEGRSLEVGYWSVHGDERRIADYIHIINGLNLPVCDVILSSIASGSINATEDEKQLGVLVVDMGAGTTDWAVFRDGVVARTGVVPVGGDHLTNDLALGLRVRYKYAEKLKREYGRCISEKDDKKEKIWMVGDQQIGDRRLPMHGIVQVLKARVQEIFTIITEQAGENLNSDTLAAGAILTGGTARLEGIEDLAAKTLGLAVRRWEHPSWVHESLRGPGYSTALGLTHHALTSHKTEPFDPRPKQKGLRRTMAKIFG